jgi:hypothetical protein
MHTQTAHQLIELDTATIAAAQHTIVKLMATQTLTAFSLTEAIAWLDAQLPTLRNAIDLLTWANAIEQAAALPAAVTPLWKQALQTEGYTLRLRARSLPTLGHSYAG